jgi:APA family basic amino acid/polyamine antiporter
MSVAACLFIMKDLSTTTVRVFVSWMAIWIVIYVLYGVRHSGLNRAASAPALDSD